MSRHSEGSFPYIEDGPILFADSSPRCCCCNYAALTIQSKKLRDWLSEKYSHKEMIVSVSDNEGVKEDNKTLAGLMSSHLDSEMDSLV